MAEDRIVKIYDLSTKGANTVMKDLDKINKQFVQIKKNKLLLAGSKARIEDPEELKKIDKELTDLVLTEKKLVKQIKEKQLALKEYQLLNAKEREERRKTRQGVDALEGSYNQIAKKYRELLALSKNAINLTNPEEVKQAQTELKKYKDLLDNFNRGLSKDGTLVGEYTTGIINAFRNNGLDNLINDQINSAKGSLGKLDSEFDKLKQSLGEVKAAGKGGFESIEREMVQNRNEAEQLRQQIERVEQELHHTGESGSRITGAIGLQFKNLKKQIGGFVLGFVGVQAALGRINRELSEGLLDAKQFDGVEQAFNRLNREDLLDNLRKATKGTVKDLELMKAAVYADNLGIEVNELGAYFEFAKQRAQDTGESVDYLVDSIVKGIGRKSLLILDNLGISATALKKEMGGVGLKTAEVGDVAKAVGNIIQRENLKTGKSLEKRSAQLERDRVKWENLRAELGQKLLPVLIKLSSIAIGVASALASIPLGPMVTLLGLAAAAWIYYKTTVIAAWVATQLATEGTLLHTIAIGANNAAVAISNAYYTTAAIVANVYSATLLRLATATGVVNVATRIFAATMAFLASPIGIVIGLTAALVTVFGVFSAKAKDASKDMEAYNQRLRETAAQNRVNAEAVDRANKSTRDTIGLLKTKLAIAKNENLSMRTRKKAVEDIIAVDKEYFKGLNLTNIATAKGTQLIDAYIKQLNRKAKAEAYAQLITEKQKKLLDLQAKRDQIIIESGTDLGGGNFEVRDTRGFLGVAKGFITGDRGPVEEFRKTEKGIRDVGDELKYLNGLLADNKDIQAELAKINGGTGIVPTGGGTGDKKDKDKVNRVNELKKQYDDEMALLETALNDREITEDQYYGRVLAKIVSFREKRLKAIQKLDKDELSSKKQFDAQLSQQRAETLNELFQRDINQLEKQKTERDRLIQKEIDENEDRLDITELERVKKRLELDTKLLDSQKKFNDGMLAIETNYRVLSADNEQQRADALLAIEKQLARDKRTVQLESFQQFQDDQESQIAGLTTQATKFAQSIYLGGGSAKEKADAIKKLEEATTKEVNALRLKQIDKEIAENKMLFDKKLLNQLEYNQRVQELENERLGILEDANKKELENERQKNRLKEEVQNAGWQITEKFIGAYLEGLRMEAEATYKRNVEILNAEEERRLGFAQSQAEKESIQREYDEKEKEAERKRNIERQQVAKKQLAIEFAVASIKALSTSLTFGEGLVKSAIALGEYLAALSLLNKQTFATGGRVEPETIGNGLVTNNPNIRPLPNGDNVLGYLKPGEVVLNKSQQAALGGPSTFASIGVPGFNNSVAPPQFRTAYGVAGGGSDSGSNAEVMEMIMALYETVVAESTKPVVLDPNGVTKYQTEQYNNVNVATI